MLPGFGVVLKPGLGHTGETTGRRGEQGLSSARVFI